MTAPLTEELSTDDELLMIIAAIKAAVPENAEVLNLIASYSNYYAVTQLERTARMLLDKGYHSATREVSERAFWLKGMRVDFPNTTTEE